MSDVVAGGAPPTVRWRCAAVAAHTPLMPVCQSGECRQPSRLKTLRAGCMLLLAERPAVSLVPVHAWKFSRLLHAFCMRWLWNWLSKVALHLLQYQGISLLSPAAPANCSSLPLPGIMAGPHNTLQRRHPRTGELVWTAQLSAPATEAYGPDGDEIPIWAPSARGSWLPGGSWIPGAVQRLVGGRWPANLQAGWPWQSQAERGRGLSRPWPWLCLSAYSVLTVDGKHCEAHMMLTQQSSLAALQQRRGDCCSTGPQAARFAHTPDKRTLNPKHSGLCRGERRRGGGRHAGLQPVRAARGGWHKLCGDDCGAPERRQRRRRRQRRGEPARAPAGTQPALGGCSGACLLASGGSVAVPCTW